MTVYVVSCGGYPFAKIVGVFSCLQRADAACLDAQKIGVAAVSAVTLDPIRTSNYACGCFGGKTTREGDDWFCLACGGSRF